MYSWAFIERICKNLKSAYHCQNLIKRKLHQLANVSITWFLAGLPRPLERNEILKVMQAISAEVAHIDYSKTVGLYTRVQTVKFFFVIQPIPHLKQSAPEQISLNCVRCSKTKFHLWGSEPQTSPCLTARNATKAKDNNL